MMIGEIRLIEFFLTAANHLWQFFTDRGKFEITSGKLPGLMQHFLP
jgi:hypothetical protein